jgi:hypothetical protein
VTVLLKYDTAHAALAQCKRVDAALTARSLAQAQGRCGARITAAAAIGRAALADQRDELLVVIAGGRLAGHHAQTRRGGIAFGTWCAGRTGWPLRTRLTSRACRSGWSRRTCWAWRAWLTSRAYRSGWSLNGSHCREPYTRRMISG